eukprot:CAMPEP_0170169386 /NCGR_PEP_ID=MMETSP0040_2-20121228/2309_1 /TAXON_ID=641309 /ORGANISM="Lotharella oceanica, Strain CCMP622" /LENGTH=214 /DNA_ID=CAMNT_0010408105 /DNA_START=66 /DNA_END=710 /DNA_ORIENTATION=+
MTIMPINFSKNLKKQLADEINVKYANKVIPDLGLCIALRAIDHVGDPKYVAGTTGMHVKVRFRLIVFRPFAQEVLTGVVLDSDKDGIKVSLGFFHDVYIPKDNMPQSWEFNEEENSWVWNYEGNPYTIDNDESVNVRVEDIEYDISRMMNPSAANTGCPPMRVVASMSADGGLGPISWWAEQDEDDDEEEVEGEGGDAAAEDGEGGGGAEDMKE